MPKKLELTSCIVMLINPFAPSAIMDACTNLLSLLFSLVINTMSIELSLNWTYLHNENRFHDRNLRINTSCVFVLQTMWFVRRSLSMPCWPSTVCVLPRPLWSPYWFTPLEDSEYKYSFIPSSQTLYYSIFQILDFSLWTHDLDRKRLFD